ncbi:MAG TPA: DnaJ family domain-containing protein [Casimicrobiaceae bacterium]|nr:DnaJ family domain-containing protein [Casimicrobiaceae bacterium]
MKTFDEEIARRIKEAADSGELRTAESYGKPLPEDPGWEATPEALRLPMKILKDAGATPPEIEWFHERARLKASIEREQDADERRKLQLKLIEIEQKIALRLEALRIHAQL